MCINPPKQSRLNQSMHTNDKYKCNKCNVSFTTERLFQQHQKQVHSTKAVLQQSTSKDCNQFVCNVCHQSKFSSYSSLKLHIQSEHPNIHKEYTSQRQQKLIRGSPCRALKTKKKTGAAGEEVSSTGVDSELACDLCSACFTASRALRTHRMTAHGIKPGQPKTRKYASIGTMLADVSSTDDGGKKRSTSPNTLSSGEFYSRSTKQVHIDTKRTASGKIQKGIKCPYCKEMCEFSWSLQRHLRKCSIRIAKQRKGIAKQRKEIPIKMTSSTSSKRKKLSPPPGTDDEIIPAKHFQVETNLGRRVRKETPKMRDLREEREALACTRSADDPTDTPVVSKSTRIDASKRIDIKQIKVVNPFMQQSHKIIRVSAKLLSKDVGSSPIKVLSVKSVGNISNLDDSDISPNKSPRAGGIIGSSPPMPKIIKVKSMQSTDKDELMCSICEKMVINSTILQQHMRLVHSKHASSHVQGIVTASKKKTSKYIFIFLLSFNMLNI